MELRVTVTKRWTDSWFSKLAPVEKLMFIFLCDNCDSAGFYELNYPMIEFLTGLRKDHIIHNLGCIKKCFIPSKDKKKIWLSKFLHHQNYLPLNEEINEHLMIVKLIENNLDAFGNPAPMLKILSSMKAKKRKSPIPSKRFIKPTFDEWTKHHLELDPKESSTVIQERYDYWESCGWKVGSKPMKDWKAAMRNMLRKKVNKNIYSTSSPSRIPNMAQAGRNFLTKPVVIDD